MKKYLILFAFIIVQGCSSGGGDSVSTAPTATATPTSIAKLYFVVDKSYTITGVKGESSLGTTETFTITSTDVNDATPNEIENGEVGVVEIQACDAFWELLVYNTDVNLGLGIDFIVAFHDMQLFSCDKEYTCKIENIRDGLFTNTLSGDLICAVNP